MAGPRNEDGQEPHQILKPLVISSNLDAMVKHEEQRLRDEDDSWRCTAGYRRDRRYGHLPSSSLDSGLSGLPPPPRRRIRMTSPWPTTSTSFLPPVCGLQDTGTSGEQNVYVPLSSSTLNPYINPAPTLSEILAGKTPAQSSSDCSPSGGAVGDHETMPWQPCDEAPETKRPSGAATHHQDLVRDGNVGPSDGGKRGGGYRFIPPVDGLFPVGRAFNFFSDKTRTSRGVALPMADAEPRRCEGATDQDKRTSAKGRSARGSPPLLAVLRLSERARVQGDGDNMSRSSTVRRPTNSHAKLSYSAWRRTWHISNSPPATPRSSLDRHDTPSINPFLQFRTLSETKSSHESLLQSPTPSALRPQSPLPPDHSKPAVMTVVIQPPARTSPQPSALASPTATKLFGRGAKPKQSTSAVEAAQALPSTTNDLPSAERAELIKKSRKLTRLFGETPGANDITHTDSGRVHGQTSHLADLRDETETCEPVPSNGQRCLGDFSLFQDLTNCDNLSIHQLATQRASFSSSVRHPEDDMLDMPHDCVNQCNLPKGIRRRRLSSASDGSFAEHISPDELTEERRRKRERLVKLQHFLGPQVPANLVLGLGDIEATLPPVVNVSAPRSESADPPRRAWLKARIATTPPPPCTDALDRYKADLDGEEKAINVRRAQKMEKIFGVVPPQTLFHTRHSPSVTPLVSSKEHVKSPKWYHPSDSLTAPAQWGSKFAISQRTKFYAEHSISESENQLLLSAQRESWSSHEDSRLQDDDWHSVVYSHYHHSLSSLHTILDRDDKESLVEVHERLRGGGSSPSGNSPYPARRISVASASSTRRHSLPMCNSVTSFISQGTNMTRRGSDDFQVRRRKAAKLTHFFGVDYPILIHDIIESIEHGLKHDQDRGMLRADEMEVLLQRLQSLKVKRTGLLS